MKTLNESLNDIRKSAMSAKSKKEACFRLGLTKNDVYALEFAGFFRTAKRTAARRITLTFGVEIECIVPADRVRAKAAEHSLPISYQGYNHTDSRHYYKFVTDSSIDDDIREGGRDNGIECVSPVLDGNRAGMASLKKCLKTLNDAYAQVNRSCGLHVHVGIAGLEGGQVVNIYKNYQMMETLIDSFMAPSRRDGCRWALPLRGFDLSGCRTQRDLERVIGTRYCKVNPMAYLRHRTVEFRQHQGTTDFEKISMWVSFCTKLVAWSMDNVLEREVTEIGDVPFLNAAEKRFFAGRISRFSAREAS